jgi:hypothetical protein
LNSGNFCQTYHIFNSSAFEQINLTVKSDKIGLYNKIVKHLFKKEFPMEKLTMKIRTSQNFTKSTFAYIEKFPVFYHSKTPVCTRCKVFEISTESDRDLLAKNELPEDFKIH